MLLEEFDPGRAVIEPENLSLKSGTADFMVREVCDILIYSFNGEIVDTIRQHPDVYEGGFIKSLNGKHPWYIYEEDGFKVAVMLACIGSPMAVGNLEELKVVGFRQFIVLGSCGVLDKNLATDKIILPQTALRDEGTSYHYAPSSDEISYDERCLVKMETSLRQAGIDCLRTKAWTTDAFFRETADKVKRRMAAGAEVVDMEAASIIAWAQYRKADVYQFFYTADYVDHHNNEWHQRHEERITDAMVFFDVAMTIAREL
ncbi:nucleoside phosphorylase [Streptococcus pluranimalium]|uniref:nucleoside phosphorylase n=1 Tax=Streptococcus pluranimalium TaxID=82348 RepID=UPI003F68F5E0